MEKFFVVFGIIAVIVIFLYAAWTIYSRILAKRILMESRGKKSFAYNYLCTRFSRRNTLKNVKLLINVSSAQGGRYLSDIGTVFVNKGGVTIVETVRGSGFVEVNEKGKWNRIINDKFHTFDDPFIRNGARVRDMKLFLRSEGIENVRVNNVVLFTGRHVKFSKRINGLITANEFSDYMIDLNRDKFLAGSEIRDVVKLIKQKSA